MSLARILVGLDLRGGLVAEIRLHKQSTFFAHTLDYCGVPFQCVRCHDYGHLAAVYALTFRKKWWIQKDPSVGKDKGQCHQDAVPTVSLGNEHVRFTELVTALVEGMDLQEDEAPYGRNE
ncbi:hypothetical protein KI387_001226, partial [Taxus chinensis]